MRMSARRVVGLLVCVGLFGGLVPSEPFAVSAGNTDPVLPPEIPPPYSEWTPGTVGGQPKATPTSKSQGIDTKDAFLFNELLGKEIQAGVRPDVSDGELDVQVGPVGERPEMVRVGAGAPMLVGAVPVDSKRSWRHNRSIRLTR
jgi:hypothetical protein